MAYGYCGVGGTMNQTTHVCIVNNAYSKNDFKDVVVDGLGTTGAAVVEWLDLIVLLVVLGFIIGIFIKLGNLFK
jgi:hypothetical protein